jgi:NAD(P)H-hydrate epimerase
MELLTAAEMQAVDRYTIETLGIPGLVLMEAAALTVFEILEDTRLDRDDECSPAPIAILCGKGNNGGDGLALACLLHAAEIGEPRVGLVAEVDALTGDAASMLARAQKQSIRIDTLADGDAVAEWLDSMPEESLVVDALLGTGVQGAARGATAGAIEAIVASGREVVSVDMPSGIETDTGKVHGAAVIADRTVTFGRPKLGLALQEGPTHCGELIVTDIGIPDVAVQHVDSRWTLLDDEFLQSSLPTRSREAHKGTQGHLLSIAGGAGMTGAAILAARGAIAGGVGLLRAVLDTGVDAFHAAVPEAVCAQPSREPFPGLLDASQAVLIGPGTVHSEFVATCLEQILADRIPALIDADAWNRIALSEDLRFRLRDRPGPTIVTPHAGEAARWLGGSAHEVQADRLRALETLVQETKACVVLKGAGTLIGHPDGRRAICIAGNPGLGTAGSGDILSGLIGALLARGLGEFHAATVGVYLHAVAADRLWSEAEGFAASDLAYAIPYAIRDCRIRALGGQQE